MTLTLCFERPWNRSLIYFWCCYGVDLALKFACKDGNIDLFSQNDVHGPLKSTVRINKSIGHTSELEQTFWGHYGSVLHFILGHLDLLATTNLIYYVWPSMIVILGPQWGWTAVDVIACMLVSLCLSMDKRYWPQKGREPWGSEIESVRFCLSPGPEVHRIT